MSITVDVVVVGSTRKAIDAAIDAARRGKRVILLSRCPSEEACRCMARARRIAGAEVSRRIRVLAGVEVECVAGVRSVEAVLGRYIETGRRVDINATSLMSFEDEPETANDHKEMSRDICR